MWKDIKNAHKIIGEPLWVKGNDFGKPDGDVHYCWGYWDGSNWKSQPNDGNFQGSTLLYLTHYLDKNAKIF